jgi:hypothetical protein
MDEQQRQTLASFKNITDSSDEDSDAGTSNRPTKPKSRKQVRKAPSSSSDESSNERRKVVDSDDEDSDVAVKKVSPKKKKAIVSSTSSSDNEAVAQNTKKASESPENDHDPFASDSD